MSVFLVNPSDVSFGTAGYHATLAVVLAAATPGAYGDPVVIDAPAQDLQDAACHRAHVAAAQRVSGVDGVPVQIIRGGQPTRHID